MIFKIKLSLSNLQINSYSGSLECDNLLYICTYKSHNGMYGYISNKLYKTEKQWKNNEKIQAEQVVKTLLKIPRGSENYF